MTDKSAMEKAAVNYKNSYDVEYPKDLILAQTVSESYMRAGEHGFKTGWQAALHGPAVTALVEALDEIRETGNRKSSELASIVLAEFEKARGGE